MRLMAYAYPEDDLHTKEVDALYFDGYHVSERLLEGLPIKVTLTDDKSDIIISAAWPMGVDTNYMAAGAKKFALFNDIFSTTPELDNNDGFILKD